MDYMYMYPATCKGTTTHPPIPLPFNHCSHHYTYVWQVKPRRYTVVPNTFTDCLHTSSPHKYQLMALTLQSHNNPPVYMYRPSRTNHEA